MRDGQRAPAGRKRIGILAMIFITVVVNYMDRSNMSVAAAALGDDLQIDTVQMGLIFSAFAWTYSALQIPGGMMVDRVRPRFLYPAILIAWSIATIAQGFAQTLAVLIACRMMIGVFEAPSYPINNKIVTSWFPEQERASAIAVYTSGQFIGIAFLLPALALVQTAFGWRGLFHVSGAVGLVWALVWFLFYRDPDEHRTMTTEERDYIARGGGITKVPMTAASRQPINWRALREAFSHRKLWGIYIGQFCIGGMLMFFLTWFPTYLVKYRGLDFIKSGFYASIPFIAAFCGVLLAGFVSDYLVRRGHSVEFARKAPVVTGMLLSTAILGANYTNSVFGIIACLSLAFFGNGLASITWVFVSLIAPKPMVGLVGGCFNFVGGLAAVIVPLVIGVLAQGGNFEFALAFIAALGLVGVASYLFLVGQVERIETGCWEVLE